MDIIFFTLNKGFKSTRHTRMTSCLLFLFLHLLYVSSHKQVTTTAFIYLYIYLRLHEHLRSIILSVLHQAKIFRRDLSLLCGLSVLSNMTSHSCLRFFIVLTARGNKKKLKKGEVREQAAIMNIPYQELPQLLPQHYMYTMYI